ncbi:MAG: hypothetical protein ACYC5N_08265, partial [Endomicrobiales bacterium]
AVYGLAGRWLSDPSLLTRLFNIGISGFSGVLVFVATAYLFRLEELTKLGRLALQRIRPQS